MEIEKWYNYHSVWKKFRRICLRKLTEKEQNGYKKIFLPAQSSGTKKDTLTV